MIHKLISGLEPFIYSLVIFAGAALAGWIKFSSPRPVGYALVVFGLLLVIEYIYEHKDSL